MPLQNPTLQTLPNIVFGTSNLGNLYQALPAETKQDIIAQWFDQSDGVVAVDTAGKYGAGLALETIGQAFRQLQIDPQQVIISNKLGWLRAPLTTAEPTFEPGAWVGLEHDAQLDISAAGIRRCWEQGCELLGGYQPQLVSVHDPDEYLAAAVDQKDYDTRWNDILEAYAVLFEMKERGEVAAIGVGSKDWRVSQNIAEACQLDWVMLATSLTIYTHPAELLDFVASLHQQGIVVINSAVFHAGFLTGGQFFDYRKVTGQHPHDTTLLTWREQFHSVCSQFNLSPAAACVGFGMHVPGVVATALSSSRPERVKTNVELLKAEVPPNFWSAMKATGLIRADYPFVD